MSDATEPTKTAEAAEAEAEPVAPPDPRDGVRSETLAALQERLGDAIVGSELAGGDLWVRVNVDAWADAGFACKALGFTYFCFLSGIDWLDNPSLSGRAVWDVEGVAAEEEVAAGTVETGVTGGDTRFQLLARVYSLNQQIGITLKCDLDEQSPSAPTWTEVYRGADWHERETWEMYGFDFVGHSGLRNLYLPQGFEGHPLRKDFPLLAREVKPWPGLVDKEPIPGEGDEGEEAAEGASEGAE